MMSHFQCGVVTPTKKGRLGKQDSDIFTQWKVSVPVFNLFLYTGALHKYIWKARHGSAHL
jgi:hypothetical protein